jgi:hypothetical protein
MPNLSQSEYPQFILTSQRKLSFRQQLRSTLCIDRPLSVIEPPARSTPMNPFRLLTRVFIDVFGITHPTPQQEQRATWFITILMAFLFLGIALVFLTLYTVAHR